MANAEGFEVAMRNLKASRVSDATKARLRALQPWMRSSFGYGETYGLTYQTCRFCKRGRGDVSGLWKYGVRHWACDDCRNSAVSTKRGAAAESRGAMQVYTMRKNAIRGAKRAGRTAADVHKCEGGFTFDGAQSPAAALAERREAARDVKAKAALAAKRARRRPSIGKRAKSTRAKSGSVTSRIKRAKHEMPRPGSKGYRLLSMLSRVGGATMAQLEAATDWAQPSIRVAIQRLCPAYGFTWQLVTGADGAKSRYEATR